MSHNTTSYNVVLEDEDVKSSLIGYTYNDLFSTNLETQAHMIYTYKRILNLRSRLLKSRAIHEDTSSQASPDISGAPYTIVV